MNKVQLLIFQMNLHLVILLQEQHHMLFTNQFQIINTDHWQVTYQDKKYKRQEDTEKKNHFFDINI